LNIQPVIPISISKSWNLISRTIVPVISQSDVFDFDPAQAGLGDTAQSLFFSPKEPTANGWIWGVGPVFLLPTATDDLLGTEKWGIGPTAVVLKQTATAWTFGSLVNYIESVAGNSDRADVRSTYLQPFLAKGMGNGRTVMVNLEALFDHENGTETIPMNLHYSKVTKLGSQMVSLQGGVRYYLDSPEQGPEWGLRFEFRLLYPKKP
jgi:hypothetical protein